MLADDPDTSLNGLAERPALTGPKRQHFLPRFYLSRFVGEDGCVAVFDRERKEVRRQQPSNTGVVGHLYTFRDEQGRQRFELENELSRIEGLASTALDRLVSGAALGEQERADFAYFVALAAVRTPEFLDTIKYTHSALIKHVTRMIFSDMEHVKGVVRSREDPPSNEKEVEEQAKRLIDFAQGDLYDIEVDHEVALQTAIPLADTIAPILFDRHWRIFEAPAKRSFVTCDAPVFLTTLGTRKGLFRGVGFSNSDALVLVPLGTKHCLAMFDEGAKLDRMRVDSGYVRRVNRGVAAQCQRYIIGKDDVLVRSIAKAAGVGSSKWTPRLQIG